MSFTTLNELAKVFEVPETFITTLGTRVPRPGEPGYQFAKLLKATQQAMLAAIEEDAKE